jgi:hypothetical protein
MSNIISLAEVRSEKLKQALSVHGSKGEAAIIEAGTGTIFAQRIICRDRFAEILDSAGDYLVVDYADIRSIRPAAVTQTSIVNANGGFQFVQHSASAPRTVPVLPFEPRRRRRP